MQSSIIYTDQYLQELTCHHFLRSVFPTILVKRNSNLSCPNTNELGKQLKQSKPHSIQSGYTYCVLPLHGVNLN